jgi:HD superfamily phosphohydrolase
MVSGSGTPTIYSAVVSSQFDADRLDYMRRDRLMTGTQHAGIDFEWLMENLEVGEVDNSVGETRLKPVQTFVLGSKAIFAAEAYVLGLFQLYPTVYFHKATRGAEKIYTELLSRAITLIKDDSVERTGLPATHPLVKFARTPDDIDCALALDDTVIWGAHSGRRYRMRRHPRRAR